MLLESRKREKERELSYTYFAYTIIKKERACKKLCVHDYKAPTATYARPFLRDISVRFSAGIRRAGSKRSLKVPLGFPGLDRLRPASQYFSNFLSKSYGTRSIMTSWEQSSFSLLAFPASCLSLPQNPQDRSPCMPGFSLRLSYTSSGTGKASRSKGGG